MFRELESDVEKAICAHAKKTGWTVRKHVSPGRKGECDRIFTRPSEDLGVIYTVVVAMEIKRPGEKPTALQMKRLNQWGDDGAWVRWVDNAEDGIDHLDYIAKSIRSS